MDPRLHAISARNGGVFTRSDAVSCGCSEREMKTATGPRGSWVVVRRGCYAERNLWNRLDEDARYALRVRAAVLAQSKDAVVSHASAAVLLGLPMRPSWRELVHVTRPGVTGSRTENGVKHHRAGYSELDVVTHADGLRITGLARTAADIAREHGYEDGVVAADAAIRLGSNHRELRRAVEPMTFWPNVTKARSAIRVADGGAQTVGESVLRVIVLALDIGEPETQYIVRQGNRWAAVDLRVGRHLFEFDGRVKYVEREHGGVADRPVQEIVWEEKKREDWLRRANGGFGVSRVVWSEMFGAARPRLMARLLREFEQTVARFGRDTG